MMCACRSKRTRQGLSEGVTKGFFYNENIWSSHKTPAFRIKFGLTVCPLERSLVAEVILALIIHLN